MRPAIAVDHLTVRAGDTTALDDVSIALDPGELVVLLGPSGSGKTTLLRAMLGLVVPIAGTVHVGGRVASRPGQVLLPPEERNLAVVFQDLALWPHLTVASHLTFGMRARGVPRAECVARSRAMLERLELGGLAARRPGELSGGERQRLAIARALVLEPAAVLLDEPLASLDVLLRRDMRRLFRSLFGRATGVPAIYVTHDPYDAAALADRVVVLDAGRVVQSGTFEQLRAHPVNPFVRALIEEAG